MSAVASKLSAVISQTARSLSSMASSSRLNTSRRSTSRAASASRSTSPPPPPPIPPARKTPTGSTVRGTPRPCSMPIGRPSRGRHSMTPSTRHRGRRATRASPRRPSTGTTFLSSIGSRSTIPGGLGSQLGKLCYYVTISEYGGPPEQQSALNLVYILGYDDSRNGQGFQSKVTPSIYGTDESGISTAGTTSWSAASSASFPADRSRLTTSSSP